MKYRWWLAALIGVLAACGAGTSVATSEIDASTGVRAEVEGPEWVVRSLDRGFSTTASVGVGQIRFVAEDEVTPATRVRVSSSCGGGSASYIEWEANGFSMIDTPDGVNTDLISEGPDCDDDDFRRQVVRRDEFIEVVVTDDVARLIHPEFEVTLDRQEVPPPTTSTTVVRDDSPTTVP